jgi:hypothetical protein
MSNNIYGFFNTDDKVKVKETADTNDNMPICFVKHKDKRNQNLLIDATPDELYYNPSSKTLFVDNIETKIANLQEGEAIQIDNSVSNRTTINVNFSKNTDVITTIADTDTLLISDSSNNLKTITGQNLKEDVKYLSAGRNITLTGDQIDLDKTLIDVNSITSEVNNDLDLNAIEINTNCNINLANLKKYKINNVQIDGDDVLYENTGTITLKSKINEKQDIINSSNRLDAENIATGVVNNTEFNRLNGITSDILESNDKGVASGVCPLDSNALIPTQYFPSSVDEIIEVANFSSLPGTGESGKIYVTLDNHKVYRWSGSSYIEISSSLSLGTVSGTAYEGSSGQQNADDISSLQSSKQDVLTFGKLNTNALKLEENVATNDILLAGASNIKGRTYSEFKNDLSLDNVENIAVSTLGGVNITYNSSTNKLNLDSTLVGNITFNNSILVDTLKARSGGNLEVAVKFSSLTGNGTGNIFLKAGGGYSTNDRGRIYLSRYNQTTARSNFIEYTNRDSNTNFITFNLHDASSTTSTVQVLKLNSDLTSDFSGDINIASGKQYKINDAQISTDHVAEATNKYYSSTLFNADLATKDTDDLSEGITNKYYSTTLFNSDFGNKNTDNLSEGTNNKYYSSTLILIFHQKTLMI